MINLYDQDAVKSIIDARQAQFRKEAEDYRIGRDIRRRNRPAPGRLRRAVGHSLIGAGARISGVTIERRRSAANV